MKYLERILQAFFICALLLIVWNLSRASNPQYVYTYYTVVFESGDFLMARGETTLSDHSYFVGKVYDETLFEGVVEVNDCRYIDAYNDDDFVIERFSIEPSGMISFAYRDDEGMWWAYDNMDIDEALVQLSLMGTHPTVTRFWEILMFGQLD